jgi:hypothetical protein
MSKPSALHALLSGLVQLAPLAVAMGAAALPFWYQTLCR